MGGSDLGWGHSRFHFSFADYFNHDSMNFGALRVLNDDFITPGGGFDMHSHRDMEIINYVIEGELGHRDSMGHETTLRRGEIQCMSAGTGMLHSEFNHGRSDLRVLQIWLYPDQKNYMPSCREYRLPWIHRQGNWLHMVSDVNGPAPAKIHQDANLHVLELAAGETAGFKVWDDRQAYLVQIDGRAVVNGHQTNPGDAVESIEENLLIRTKTQSHFLVLEMSAILNPTGL